MATVVDTDISCFGANNGVITITNSAGGYGTFQYSINGGSTWQDSPVFSSLSAGSYDVRIRDRAHITCVTVLPAVLITEPAALSAVATGTNVTCNGANDGTITISGHQLADMVHTHTALTEEPHGRDRVISQVLHQAATMSG